MATKTNIQTPVSSLPNQRVNTDILRQELVNSGVTPNPSQVYQSGTDVITVWDELLTGDEEVAATAVIAAHSGEPFAAHIQQAVANDDLWGQAPLDTASTSWVTVLEHDSGYLPADTYLLQWTAEMRVAPEADGEDVEMRALLLDWKGLPEVEISLSANDSDRWRGWANGTNIPVLAGERIKIRFEARSVGGQSTGSVRRMRMRIGRA
jgi:hypothetical protein